MEQQHPINRCLAGMAAALKDVADLDPMFMTPAAKREALVAMGQVGAAFDGLRMRLIASADEVAEADGNRDVANWLGDRTTTSVRAARVEQRLATALDQRWHRVAGAMGQGAVTLEQAKVVLAGLDALPHDLEADQIAKAETHAVELCATFGPEDLRQLMAKILEVIAPEIAEAVEAQRLEDEERTARERMRLTIRRLAGGVSRVSALIPTPSGDRLRTYLEAFTSPRKHDQPESDLDQIPYPRRRAQAFCALLEHLDPTKLPHHGGDATTVMVATHLDDLRNQLGTATMLDGSATGWTNLSADEARRLACTAHIIPVVLGAKGEILNLGRMKRLYTPARRKAMRLRDRQCRAHGCRIPATWCEAHHLKPWSEGGKTDLADGILLCSWHHHRIHDKAYESELLPGGDVVVRKRRT